MLFTNNIQNAFQRWNLTDFWLFLKIKCTTRPALKYKPKLKKTNTQEPKIKVNF